MKNLNSRLDTLYKSDVITLPNIKIVSNENVTGENTVLYETEETSPFFRQDDTVLTLLLNGSINSYYKGINHEFRVRSRTCTLVYGPGDNEHHVQASGAIDSMAIGINKQFFHNLMQDGDRLVENILNKIERREPFSLSPGAYRLTPQMFATVTKIRSSRSITTLRNLHLQNFVSELLLQQFQEVAASTTPYYTTVVREADIKKLRELKAYLDDNFLSELTLDYLVKTSGLNTYKVKTGFKALYNQSVFEYIRHLRMKHAHHLLLEGSYNISEVAFLVGYEHVQHFSTAFKKYFGASPGKFKY